MKSIVMCILIASIPAYSHDLMVSIVEPELGVPVDLSGTIVVLLLPRKSEVPFEEGNPIQCRFADVPPGRHPLAVVPVSGRFNKGPFGYSGLFEVDARMSPVEVRPKRVPKYTVQWTLLDRDGLPLKRRVVYIEDITYQKLGYILDSRAGLETDDQGKLTAFAYAGQQYQLESWDDVGVQKGRCNFRSAPFSVDRDSVMVWKRRYHTLTMRFWKTAPDGQRVPADPVGRVSFEPLDAPHGVSVGLNGSTAHTVVIGPVEDGASGRGMTGFLPEARYYVEVHDNGPATRMVSDPTLVVVDGQDQLVDMLMVPGNENALRERRPKHHAPPPVVLKATWPDPKMLTTHRFTVLSWMNGKLDEQTTVEEFIVDRRQPVIVSCALVEAAHPSSLMYQYRRYVVGPGEEVIFEWAGPSRQVSGRLRVDAAAPEILNERGLGFLDLASWSPAATAQMDAQGNYTCRLPPGTYRAFMEVDDDVHLMDTVVVGINDVIKDLDLSKRETLRREQLFERFKAALLGTDVPLRK